MPETTTDTPNAESIAVQVITENSDLARQYAAGDLAALPALHAKAVTLAAGRLSEKELENTLMRKLGASI